MLYLMRWWLNQEPRRVRLPKLHALFSNNLWYIWIFLLSIGATAGGLLGFFLNKEWAVTCILLVIVVAVFENALIFMPRAPGMTGDEGAAGEGLVLILNFLVWILGVVSSATLVHFLLS